MSRKASATKQGDLRKLGLPSRPPSDLSGSLEFYNPDLVTLKEAASTLQQPAVPLS